MSKIPNPSGQKVAVGDKVKITNGEFAGYVGEVVAFYDEAKNWVQRIKIANADGTFGMIEVKDLAIEFFALASDIIKSNVFKRFSAWVVNLFRKKKNKEPKN